MTGRKIVQYRGEKIFLEPRKKVPKDPHPQASVLKWNIQYLMNRYSSTRKELAAALDLSDDTFSVRMAEPWRFTVSELEKLAAFWKLTVPQLMTEIQFIAEEPITLADERYI